MPKCAHSLLLVAVAIIALGFGSVAKVDHDQIAHILHGPWKPMMPPGILDRGVVYTGAGWRLRRFVATLLAGRTVKVGAIGGSVSWGHGASMRGTTDWFSLFIKWLRLAFPKATVLGRNGCIPGTGTQLTLYCIEETLDPDVDLVFEEFATNDGHFTNIEEPRTAAQERLMRKILNFPSRPALVMLSFLQPCHAVREQTHKHRVTPCYFHQSPEDQYNVVAQYYDVAALSFRNMVWHMAHRNVTPWTWSDWLIEDLKHPNDKGCQMIAELAIRLIQRVATEMTFRPYNHEKESRHTLQEQLPPPIFPGNHEPSTRCCAYQEELKKYVVSHDGWDFINEGTEEKPKKGYVSHTPGSTIVMKAPLPPAGQVNSAVMVFVTYLKSYTPMGSAVMTCEGGCSCNQTLVVAQTQDKTSQSFLAQLIVNPGHTASDCLIRVVTQANGDGTKFKVSGLLVVLQVVQQWIQAGFDFSAPFEVFEQGDGVLPLSAQ